MKCISLVSIFSMLFVQLNNQLCNADSAKKIVESYLNKKSNSKWKVSIKQDNDIYEKLVGIKLYNNSFSAKIIDKNGVSNIVNGTIFEFCQVIVLNRDIGSGTEILSSDVIVKYVPKNQYKSIYCTDISNIIGRVALHDIKKNMPLEYNNLVKKVLVKKDAIVTLAVSISNLNVTTRGIAMDDGCIGDLIRVKNETSNKIVSGIVQEGATVKVNAA